MNSQGRCGLNKVPDQTPYQNVFLFALLLMLIGCQSELADSTTMASDASENASAALGVSAEDAPVTLRITEKVDTQASQLNAEFEFSKGKGRQVFSSPVVVYGDAKQQVEKEFTLQNRGSKTIRIERMVSSCGCSGMELSHEVLQPEQSTTLRVDFNIDPSFSQTEKKVAVKIYFNGQGVLDLVTNLHIYPGVVLSEEFRDSSRRSLDAGNVTVLADSESEFSADFVLSSISDIERNLTNEDCSLQIEDVLPKWCKVTINPLHEVTPVEGTLESGRPLFRRDHLLSISGPTDSIPAQVEVKLKTTTGLFQVFTVVLNKSRRLSASPESVVLKKISDVSFVELDRSDEFPLDIVTIETDDHLGIRLIDKDSSSAQYEISLVKQPDKPLTVFYVTFVTSDEQAVRVRVACVSTKRSKE